jgi:hypothetical protein
MGTSDGASQIYKIVRTYSALWKLNFPFSWPSTRGKIYFLPSDYNELLSVLDEQEGKK